MHDIDRTLAETSGGGSVFEPESYDFGELETDGAGEGELADDGPVMAGEADYGELELQDEGALEGEEPLGEVEEMELAAELLAVNDEADFESFLRRLIRGASRGVRALARSPLGDQLGGLLKNAARKLVPVAGRALGGLVGGPAGAALGSQLADVAARNFGLELEAMSQEDQEFELARGYVRFANDAVRQAARLPRHVPPAVAARTAVARAAHRHAPGLLRRYPGRGAYYGASYVVPVVQTNGQHHGRSSGRWVRVAPGRILLYGL